MMEKRITVVVAYQEDEFPPAFRAGMKVLGGEIVAVQFNDALAELVQLTDKKGA